ncbi:MAG: hypothetical protein K1060chlam5_00707 [Candidatus Anoxychlamydiales bacterium]|nr:hypothetical protein [Candidatus Anoxychlamydiales bacterium]
MKKVFEESVTLIIPSYKREKYLKRILKYYKDIKIKILIADSSPKPLENHKDYNCEYYHYPNMWIFEKLLKIVKKVKTPYLLFCADDDFIIISSVCKCFNFLEKNNQYSCADGNYINFNEKNLLKNIYLDLSYNDYNEKDIQKRLFKALTFNNNRTYVNNFYALHRSNYVVDAFEALDNNGYGKLEKKVSITPEFTLLFFGHIKGGYRRLPIFYAARSNGVRMYSNSDIIGWNNMKAEEFNIFKKSISHYIIKIFNVEKKYAEDSFEKIFNFWVNHFEYLHHIPTVSLSPNSIFQKNGYFKVIISNFLPNFIKKIVRKILNKIKSLLSKLKIFFYEIFIDSRIERYHLVENSKFSYLKLNYIKHCFKRGYPFLIDFKAIYEWNKIKRIIKQSNSKNISN